MTDKVKTYVNSKGQTVAQDQYGSWKVYNSATGKFGAYAIGPETVVPGPAPAGTEPGATADAAKPVETPKPVVAEIPQTPVASGSSAGSRVRWTRALVAVGAVIGIVAGLATLVHYYPSPKIAEKQTTADQHAPPPRVTQEPVASVAPVVTLAPVAPAPAWPAPPAPAPQKVAGGPCMDLSGTHWSKGFGVCVPNLKRR